MDVPSTGHRSDAATSALEGHRETVRRGRHVPRSVKNAFGRLDYELKIILARYPALAMPAARRRGRGVLLGTDTEILIEGFPRSANSFAVTAFQLAQPRPVRIAHHVHAPAHVMAAVKAGVPALVLIREPEETVLTFVIRHPDDPEISMRQALRGYVRFYAPLVRYRRGFVVGAFPEVTADFGAVIRRVNQRFGTNFAEFEHTDANVARCFQAIELHWRDTGASDETLERVVARPSELRGGMREELRASYRATVPSRARNLAEDLYRQLVGERPAS